MRILRFLLHMVLLTAVMLAVILIVPARRYFRESREEETAAPEVTPEETLPAEETEAASGEPDYVYYELLDDQQKLIYQDALATAEEKKRSFTPSVLVPAEEIKEVLEALYYDHAELYWLDISYSYMYDDEGLCHQVTLDFNETADDPDASDERFVRAAREIIDEAEKLTSDEEKERYVHDALLERIEYDETAGEDQSAYGALTEGRAVCAGYARSFQYIMNALGVPVYYVTGTAEGTDHAWNMICLDGEYYNVDLTWDDQTPDRYMCFNRSDSFFAKDHERSGLSMFLPACPEDR